MLEKIQEAKNAHGKITTWKYYKTDFYGPFVEIKVREVKGIRPYVELVNGSYKVEDASVAIGINRVMLEAAKELFKEYGSYTLVTRFGEIYIKDENVEKVFQNLIKSINLF